MLNYEDMVLILGGPDSGMLKSVKEKAQRLGINDKIIFLDVVDNMPLWLNIFDIFLFPSKFEGLGIVLLECQACGTAFFASTNVPKNVDMGLGLANFIDLDETSEKWANKIVNSLIYTRPQKEKIIKEFKNKKFLIAESSKILKNIYLNSKNKDYDTY